MDISSLENMSDIQNMVGGEGGGNLLMLSIVFGIIGMLYFSYGKKRDDKEMFMYAGIGLMGFPYVVDTQMATLVIGAILMGLPFVMKPDEE